MDTSADQRVCHVSFAKKNGHRDVKPLQPARILAMESFVVRRCDIMVIGNAKHAITWVLCRM
jgi:hypothetical protein